MSDEDLIEYMRVYACVHLETGKRRLPSDVDDKMFDLAADRIETLKKALEGYSKLRGSLLEKDSLCEEIDKIKKQVIWGFYEEEYPIYSHYPDIMELHEIVNADEVNGMVEMIERLTDENAALHQTAQAVIYHDERGQGQGFQDAMDRLHRLVIEDRK